MLDSGRKCYVRQFVQQSHPDQFPPPLDLPRNPNLRRPGEDDADAEAAGIDLREPDVYPWQPAVEVATIVSLHECREVAIGHDSCYDSSAVVREYRGRGCQVFLAIFRALTMPSSVNSKGNHAELPPGCPLQAIDA